MKPHNEAYISSALCAVVTTVMVITDCSWWQIASGVIATLICLAIVLDLHTQHRDRQKLRGQA